MKGKVVRYFVWGASYRGSSDRPRVIEAETPEEIIEKLYQNRKQNLTTGTFLAVPVEHVSQITVKPKREFEITVEKYYDDDDEDEL